MKAIATILVFLFFASLLAGCGKPKASPPKITRLAPQEQSVSFRGGPERKLYDKPFSRVWDASLSALARLNLQLRRAVPALGRIDARDAEGNPVIIEIQPKDSAATYVEIQTVLGNERTASEINALVRSMLEKGDSSLQH